jgi:hypothetical protein
MARHRKTVTPASVARVQSLRFSGAAGTHGDRRTRRMRSRSAARHAAIRFDESVSGYKAVSR